MYQRIYLKKLRTNNHIDFDDYNDLGNDLLFGGIGL